MGCIGCGRGFHDECINGGCDNCHGNVQQLARSLTSIGGATGAPVKQGNIKDRLSTGRKRAAMLYPINEDNPGPCEWQGMKNCGGGQPITGCIDGIQVDRHHGPVKDPIQNTPGNVHRICKKCHNRWHTVNDPIYVESEYRNLPHSPEPASEMELVVNEATWRNKRWLTKITLCT